MSNNLSANKRIIWNNSGTEYVGCPACLRCYLHSLAGAIRRNGWTYTLMDCMARCNIGYGDCEDRG